MDPRVVLREQGMEAIVEKLATTDYVIQDVLLPGLEIALRLGKPLLVSGLPGAGKTAMAEALVKVFDLPYFHLQGMDGLTVEKVIGDWDRSLQNRWKDEFVAARGETNLLQTFEQANERVWDRMFLQLGSVGAAYDYAATKGTCLLLLDEVDKLSKLIHNMLLELFDRGVAHIPHLDGHIGSYDRKSWPIVVMTSNEETELSEALMSRCCFANLKRPTLIEELNILAKRVPEATPQMVVMVGRLIAGFRMMTGYRTRPGVREAIDLLRLIAEWKVESVDRETLRKCSGLLVKNVTDSERFSGEIQLDLLLSHMEHFNEEVKQWLA
jgi:MoxR-like ATPase